MFDENEPVPTVESLQNKHIFNVIESKETQKNNFADFVISISRSFSSRSITNSAVTLFS